MSALSGFHLRFGWWCLLAFLSLGIILESLHAVKAGLLVDVDSSIRRQMWTLAHAHGTLMGLLHIAYAYTIGALPDWPERSRLVASRCLLIGSILIPVGFLLGGVWIHAGDPGLLVLLVPPGALLLFAAVLLTALAATRRRADEERGTASTRDR